MTSREAAQFAISLLDWAYISVDHYTGANNGQTLFLVHDDFIERHTLSTASLSEAIAFRDQYGERIA